MKQFILMLLMFTLALGIQAQTATIEDGRYQITQAGATSDTLTASTTLGYNVYVSTPQYLTYRVSIKTTVTDTAQYSCYLQGSPNNSDWTNIDTTAVDTNINQLYTMTASNNTWRYLRVYFVATAVAQKSAIKVYWDFWRQE